MQALLAMHRKLECIDVRCEWVSLSRLVHDVCYVLEEINDDEPNNMLFEFSDTTSSLAVHVHYIEKKFKHVHKDASKTLTPQ